MSKKRKSAHTPAGEVPSVGDPQLCYKSQIDYFGRHWPMQGCIQRSEYCLFEPVTALQPTSNVVEFVLPPTGDQAYDLSNLYLRVALKIKRSDGQKLGPFKEDASKPTQQFDPVALCCSPLQSLWKQLELYINDQPVNSNSLYQHYKAYIANLVNYTSEAKKCLLASSLFYSDGGTDPGSANFASNFGLPLRAKFTENEHTCYLEGRLHHDLFSCVKLLPPGTKVTLRLHRNSDAFVLLASNTMAARGYKTSLEKASLNVLRVQLAPHALSYVETRLLSRPIAYHFLRTEIRRFVIPQGTTSYTAQNVWNQVPNQCLIGLVRTDAFNGRLDVNGFCFEPFGLSSICQKVDHAIRGPEIKPNWSTASGYMYAYVQMLRGLRTMTSSGQVDIDLDSFKKGNCLFTFDNSPDSSYDSPCGEGLVSYDFRFESLSRSVTGVCYGVFYSTVFIDGNGQVTVHDRIVYPD